MNEETAKVIKILSSLDTCVLKVYVAVEAAAPFIKDPARVNRGILLPVDIVVYGQKPIRHSVGHILSSARMYLQHPCHQDPNTYYDNPHFLKAADISTSSGMVVKALSGIHASAGDSDIEAMSPDDKIPEDDLPANVRFQRKIDGIFNSLTRYKSLKRLEADVRITTPLRQ
jgi:SWI/SNF-related matrix-associated actin-dependent regulator of chromatin subfamily A3